MRAYTYVADVRQVGLVSGWDRARQAEPGKSRIILIHTSAEAQSLQWRGAGPVAGIRRPWPRRDSRLESVLQRRAPESALSMERSWPIGQELAQSVSIGRDRDRCMSR